MKKLFSLLIFFVAFSVNAQIITNVDKLRINEIAEIQASGKILVVDSDNVVQWISEDKITPDLSGYYTKIDVDAILENYYDKGEVDLLLSDIDLSDYYTKSEVDNLLANLPTGTPSLADVLVEGNSAGDLKITNLADGVNAGDAVNKGQLDSARSPLVLIETQGDYKAIAVREFSEVDAGTSYSEGSIDLSLNEFDNQRELGRFSLSAGNASYSVGENSVAFGGGFSEGYSSFSLGQANALGEYSVAIGITGGGEIPSRVSSSGIASVAMGRGTQARGDYSVAMGSGTQANGNQSVAMGSGTQANGNHSVAMGNISGSNGDYSVAMGNSALANGYASVAMGNFALANGFASVAMGNYVYANEYASLAIGEYSTVGDTQTEWVNGSPIFKVGNGSSIYYRNNAYTLYNDGRSEQEKDMEVTTVGQGFVLKSPNGTRWRITVDNNGDLSAEQL